MAGRRTFRQVELDELRRLIREKQTADRDRQKILRGKMRRIGFYISDFADYSGFTVSDFDDLLQRGLISSSDAASSVAARKPAAARAEPLRGQASTADSAGALAWYDELRERYRPAQVSILLIAESPPDPGAGERRFFYSPTLSYDNLYRGVAEAVYGTNADVDVANKPSVLARLRDDGFWLIDAVEHPINKVSTSARRSAILTGVPRLIDRCRELCPSRGVIICHGKVYEAAAPALRSEGVRILHDGPLPFPLGNWRAQFVTGMRRALGG